MSYEREIDEFRTSLATNSPKDLTKTVRQTIMLSVNSDTRDERGATEMATRQFNWRDVVETTVGVMRDEAGELAIVRVGAERYGRILTCLRSD